ncbi:GNAT family N-acetyltransferase [Alkalihalobacillus sp. FSL W8-0930]
MDVYHATLEDLKAVSHLFNNYREFYQQKTDLTGATSYIQERLTNQDSIIIVAKDGHDYLGFAQLYPTFSSIAMQKAFILNDLYVSESARKRGVGDGLLQAVKDTILQHQIFRLSLSTAFDNHAAQRLYEKHGFVRDTEFYHYQLTLE